MPPIGFLVVGAGAALGAWLRWLLGVVRNALVTNLPLGTLAANLTGGFLMGVVLEVFDRQSFVPLTLRLFVTAGFLGGFTTFSSFSGEVVGLVTRREWLWESGAICAHVAGSLLLTLAGIFVVRALWYAAAP